MVEDLGGRRVGNRADTGSWSLFRLLDLDGRGSPQRPANVLMLASQPGPACAPSIAASQPHPTPVSI